MKIVKCMVAAFMFCSMNAMADSHGMGNGGDAVVCYSDALRSSVISVQFFDYWEQPQVQSYGAIDLGPARLSVQEKIKIATGRVAKFDPNLAEFIEKAALNLANNIQNYLVTTYVLPEIRDANPKVIPQKPNCFIEQFAVQYKDVQTGQRRFYISDAFYNHASTTNDDRAGLLLHEAIYRHAILKKDVKNSDGVRFFNYAAASRYIETIVSERLSQYLDLLKVAELENEQCVLAGQLWIKSDSYTREGPTCYNQILHYGSITVSVAAQSDFHGWWSDPWIATGYSIPTFPVTIANADGSILSFKATSFKIHGKNQLEFYHVEPSNGLAFPQMYGPLNRYYDCESFDVSIDANEIIQCSLRENMQPYNILEFSKTGVSDEWVLEIDNGSGYKFPVLGSRKYLSLRPYRCLYSWCLNEGPFHKTRVNSSLQMIAGNIQYHPEQQMSVEVHGNTFHVMDFEVQQRSGKYVLVFTSAEKVFPDSKIRNLRLIDSSGDFYSHAEVFCQLNGMDKGYASVRNKEYIDSRAEQFYDLATNSVVYKTDEDVDVITEIFCYPTLLETDDY